MFLSYFSFFNEKGCIKLEKPIIIGSRKKKSSGCFVMYTQKKKKAPPCEKDTTRLQWHNIR